MKFFSFIPLLFILIILIILSTNICFAEPKILDAPIIEHWMASQHDFGLWGNENEALLSTYQDESEAVGNPMEMSIDSMTKPLKAVGLYTSANKLALKNGFESMDHWAEITLRITKAAAALELEKHPEMLDLSNLKALAESQKMDEKQKAMLMDAAEMNKAMVEQFITGSSDADKKAVKPFLDRIHQLMDEQD